MGLGDIPNSASFDKLAATLLTALELRPSFALAAT
jgi:hypothetical protein